MSRFLLAVFLALGGVRAESSESLDSTDYYPKSNENPYFAVRIEDTGEEKTSYLDILQEITADLGLKVSTQWIYPNDSIVSGPNYQDLCTALDELADTNPEPPTPDEVLSLENRRCPLEKGSILMPWHHVASAVMPCEDIHYLVRIESKDSTPEKPEPYVTVYTSFFPC